MFTEGETTQPIGVAHPKWIEFALAHRGMHEVAGDGDNPTVVEWLAAAGLPKNLQHDSTAWCGVTARACVVAAGLTPPHGAAAARNWIGWGTELAAPVEGCIAVFHRVDPAQPNVQHGHVGFVMGVGPGAVLQILGGNEDNQLRIKPYPTARLLWLGWPPGVELPPNAQVKA